MLSIGVDLGGTKICTGLLDETGELITSTEVPTEAHEGPERVIERILDTIRLMMERADKNRLIGIGIAAPGPLDYPSGELHSPPNLPGWNRIALRSIIERETGMSTVLDNDANAAAVAEYLYGAGEKSPNMVYVTVSTGIGAGVVLDGSLRRGTSGAAAEVGHMVMQMDGPLCSCGNKGCLEVLASGTAIGSKASKVYGESMSAKQVVSKAEQGDVLAKQILEEAFHALGIGMVNVVNLYDPSIIVIGGGVAQIGDPLFHAVRAEVAGNKFRGTSAASVRVVPALLGTRAGVIGAGALPFLENPSLLS